MTVEEIEKYNQVMLEFLSVYLNDYSRIINEKQIMDVTKCGVDDKYAFALLLGTIFGLDVTKNSKHKELFETYFLKMITEEDAEEYKNNLYYKNVLIKEFKYKNWSLKFDKYLPYEGFVRDDMVKYPSGVIIPQIGYFKREFVFPAIYENDRLWMSITPNEINTMKKDISDSFGSVLTLGLGIGYYSYMVSLKDNVKKVTIIEKDKNAIEIFKKCILPFFKFKEKIEIINEDAFTYLQTLETFDFDFIFSDLWHDVSDGLPLYKKLKKYEEKNKDKIWRYWIEKTLFCYLSSEKN